MRERAAVTSWIKYMDACKNRKFSASEWEEFLATSEIRELEIE